MSGKTDWYWIRESGTCSVSELPALTRSFTQPQDCAVAFYADRFLAANCGCVETLLEAADTLLELRIFRKNAEFWVHRTDLSAEFSWRIADDEILKERQGDMGERYRMETRQILDISPNYEPYREGELDNLGCRKLRSSGGGEYALPLDRPGEVPDLQKQYGYVLLVNYLTYGGSGIAGVADFRLAGFSPLSGKEDSDEAGN